MAWYGMYASPLVCRNSRERSLTAVVSCARRCAGSIALRPTHVPSVASLSAVSQAKHILTVCERLAKAEDGREAGAIPNTVKGAPRAGGKDEILPGPSFAFYEDRRPRPAVFRVGGPAWPLVVLERHPRRSTGSCSRTNKETKCVLSGKRVFSYCLCPHTYPFHTGPCLVPALIPCLCSFGRETIRHLSLSSFRFSP